MASLMERPDALTTKAWLGSPLEAVGEDLTHQQIGPFLVLFVVLPHGSNSVWFCCDRRSGRGVELSTQELRTFEEDFRWDYR